MIGPLTFRTKDEPDFIPAKVTIIAMCSVAIASALALRSYYLWENKKRDARTLEAAPLADFEFADRTDKENPGFRYRL